MVHRFVVVLVFAGCTFDPTGESGGGGAGDSDGASTGVGPTTSNGTSVSSAGSSSSASTSESSTLTSASASTSEASTSSSGGESTDTGEPTGGSSATSQGTESSTGPVCVATPEVCDDVDNDCDEAIDEGSPMNLMCDGCRFVLSADASSYFALCPGPVAWEPARDACEPYGGDLAVIDDGVDQQALLPLVLEDYWIGLSDDEEEGHWVWVDGTDAIVDGAVMGYDGWSFDQPSGGKIENCAELDPGQSGWADSPCEQPQPYICRHPA